MDQTIKVLHVDDESDFLYQAKIFLEKEEEKLYLTTSQTPKKALELLETQDFDVIVADYQMPSMDGLEFLKEIREERESDIPFIIFTGKGREEVAMKSLNLGADRYLQKGGDPKAQFGVLADAIMQEVSHYKSEKEKMQYTQELKFLNDVMINIARMKKVDEICDYIAEKVYTLNQENYVVVSLYDREIDAIRVRSFAGFDEYGQMIKEQFVSGEDKITFDPYILDEWKEKYRSGNLELMPEGLYSLVKGVLKKEEAKKFEELLGVEEVYSAGFSLERKPYGGITILKSEKGDPRFKSAIETIASQLSVILHKKQDEKRQRLSNFSLDNASLEIYWIRPDGEFIFANETVTDRLGYSKEKLKDMHVWDIDPNHNEDIRGERWEMLKEEGTLTFESEHETKDGDVYPVEITSSYLEFDGKEYEFAFAEDITERKKAEQKLKESEERYRTLFNSIRDAILVADTDRNIINCNPAFVDLFGYELEEIVGKKTKYVYHDVEQFEEMEEEIEEHMGEEDFYFTIDYEKKSEEVFPGETKVFYLRDDEGEITGFIGLIRDITERRRKDKKLEASEERYRRLFETAQDGMLILNAETGKIKDANPYIQDLLGYSKEELVGKELWEIGTFKSVVENRERFEELVEEGYIRYEDLPLKTKDGEEAPVEFVSNTYEASGEKVVQCNIRDINERKEKEKALQEAKKNYEELFEKSADALFVHDADTGEILNVNQRVCEMFGYSREEALEMTIEDFSSREHPYTQEEAEKRLQKAREEGPITLEWRAQKKDDTLFWVEITLKETKIGGESRILVSIRDISERKEREQELKRKDIYLDHIPEFVNVIDENGEIIYQSQTFSDEDVLGLDEIIGSNMLEFVHPDDREKVQETFFEALENPGEEYRIELR
ncbi:MAG: PAS domain S-box protein, partial [Thermoplasmatota archaeon]